MKDVTIMSILMDTNVRLAMLIAYHVMELHRLIAHLVYLHLYCLISNVCQPLLVELGQVQII